MTEGTERVSRRSFLFAVGAGGAVTATAAIAKSVPEVAPVRLDDNGYATRGYHTSPHVNAYYRTARM